MELDFGVLPKYSVGDKVKYEIYSTKNYKTIKSIDFSLEEGYSYCLKGCNDKFPEWFLVSKEELELEE